MYPLQLHETDVAPMSTQRQLRSGKQIDTSTNKTIEVRRVVSSRPPKVLVPPCFTLVDKESDSSAKIQIFTRGSALPHISKEDLIILRAKQEQLKKTRRSIEAEVSSYPASNRAVLGAALSSTLIFAQHEAGTAVCVGYQGSILTCAHCFGESGNEWRREKRKWMLFYTGHAVLVECGKWDSHRDLALARVVALELEEDAVLSSPSLQPVFSWLRLPDDEPGLGSPIACVGQPGRDDLESTSPGRKTTYNLVEISAGRFCGLVDGVDPQDCSNIGTLRHDAWTYWGHSGAPLVRSTDGKLIGIHSSWDDQTAMRHGVPWVAMRAFLENAVDDETK